jgi:polar amino acid transport system substrate-binding protein
MVPSDKSHPLGVRGAAVVLVASLFAVLIASAQSAPLAFVSTAWPPFTSPPGQPRFALDLVEAALGRFGVTSKTAIVSAAQFTPSLIGGRYDGSAAAWKDAQREGALLYSQPYLENRLVLIGRHGANVAAKTLGDLKGKRVAVVDGYAYGDTIDSSGPMWVRSTSEEDSVARLLNSSVEYTLIDELVVQYLVSNYPKESSSRLQIGSTPLVRRELYLAIRRSRPDAQSLIQRFNAQLRGMIADGTYHRLLHVEWIRADVNGDGVPEYVAASTRPGPAEPKAEQSYTLFSTSTPAATRTDRKTGFYIGGNIYSDWASVPSNYKTSNSAAPDPRGSTASIFTFKW